VAGVAVAVQMAKRKSAGFRPRSPWRRG